MLDYVQPRGDHDPFSPHEPVGEPAVPDPSGGGGAPPRVSLTKGGASIPEATPPLAEAPAAALAAEAKPPKTRRRPSRRRATRVDDRLAADLAALGEREP